jgi:hypothetical protein
MHLNIINKILILNIILTLIKPNFIYAGIDFLIKIQIPIDIKVRNDGVINSKQDGSFIWETYENSISGERFGIAVSPNLKHFFFRPHYYITHEIEGKWGWLDSGLPLPGQQYTMWVEAREVNETRIIQSGEMILKTLSNKGFMTCQKELHQYAQYRKIVDSSGRLIKNLDPIIINSPEKQMIIKYDNKGGEVNRIIIDSDLKFNLRTIGYDFVPPEDSFENKNLIAFKVIEDSSGKFISFYRLTDSDLLSSPNRITLGSSQNGSLTATVNNPEKALLNIQSSTNLIDWNTFKTIKNEPSLEIVVPANKPKEFIRAIE